MYDGGDSDVGDTEEDWIHDDESFCQGVTEGKQSGVQSFRPELNGVK